MSSYRDQVNSLLIIQQATVLKSITNGWNETLIRDYTQRAQAMLDLADQFTITGSGDPNTNNVSANSSGFYFDTATNDLWINPTFGATSGWINKG